MVREGYKRTVVGEIPEDWELRPIGSMGSVASGGTPSRTNLAYWNGTIPWVTTTQINFNTIDSAEQFVTEEGLNNSAAKLYPPGTLLMAMYGQGKTRGKVAILGVEASTNQACAAILLDRDVQQDYIFHYLASQYEAIRNLSNTGNQENLNGLIIKSIKIPIPPLKEQVAIAQALSDVDALIASLDKLITKKRHLKTAAMQQLLIGKKRLPGFGEGKGYKQTEIGTIPEGWEIKTLGLLTTIQRGASPRPIDSPIWYDPKSTVGWVRISDITASDGKILRKTQDYLSNKGIAQSRFLPAGSLIMSICATVGIPVITQLDACIHDGFVGFSDLKNVNQEFLYYKLKELEPFFKSKGQTGSQSNLNSDLVRDCEIALPTRGEQQAIAAVLSDMDAEIAALEARRAKTQAIKQGMMQELLTGKTRLMEPAHA